MLSLLDGCAGDSPRTSAPVRSAVQDLDPGTAGAGQPALQAIVVLDGMFHRSASPGELVKALDCAYGRAVAAKVHAKDQETRWVSEDSEKLHEIAIM
jgi:hypothetical protein